MPAFKPLSLGALLFSVADGARVAKRRAAESTMVTIDDVPVYFDPQDGPESMKAENDWIVMLKSDQSDDTINTFAATNSGHHAGVPFVAWHGAEDGLRSLIKQHEGQIEYVEVDFKVEAPAPMFVDDEPTNMWNLDKVGVGQTRRSGKGVHIYVFDTGVHVDHEDFGGRAVPAIDTMQTGGVTVCSPGDTRCAADTHGHGTHCAGTAAGTQYGVAKQANVHAAKVCCGRNSNVMGGFDWVTRNAQRPALVTMSLGGSRPGTSLSAERAVNAVVDSGITVVVAAGNSNADSCRYRYGFVSSSITVGSTDSRDTRSYFSNYGSCNDLYAPGSAIRSAKPGGGSQVMSGTSMACPAVAGAVALLLDKDANSSPAKIKRDLKLAAKKNVLSGLKSGDPNELLFVGEF